MGIPSTEDDSAEKVSWRPARKLLIIPILALVFGLTTWGAGALLPGAKAGDFNRWDLALGIATTVVAATMWLWSTGGAGPAAGEGQRPPSERTSSVKVAGGHQVNLAGSVIVSVAALAVLAVVMVTVLRVRAEGAPVPADPARPSAGPDPAGAILAQARWCCKLVQEDPEIEQRYYWPHSAVDLVAAKRAGKMPEMPYAGKAAIEVAVQSGSANAVLLQRIQIRVRERRENPKGLSVTVPCECGAGGEVRRFRADLDDPKPTVRPERDDDSDDFYYVRPDSPEMFLLTVTDKRCDCLFDLELRWLADGREGTTVLDNDGRHFRLIGSAGLTRYTLS